MRAWKRLKSLLGSDRGNVLMIGAAAMPLLMGSAGMAIDTIQMSFWKRQLQRAADSASLAGAHALVQGAPTDPAVANDIDEHIALDLVENETPVLQSRDVIAPSSYAAGVVMSGTCATRSTSPCYPAVQVRLVAQRRLPFISLFTGAGSTIRANASSAVIAGGRFCMVSLYDGNDAGVRVSGNVDLSLGCGIATNSRAGNAFDIDGGSHTILANPISAVGGITSSFSSATEVQPYSSPIGDPFKDVPDPVAPSPCTEVLTVGNNQSAQITSDRCFASIDVNSGGTLTIRTAKVYVKGLFNAAGTVTSDYAAGTTLFLMGDTSDLSASGSLTLTAPTVGDYAGIAIFRQRGAANPTQQGIHLTGGTNLSLSGAIYAPSTDFALGGNGDIGSQCLQLVGRKLWFHGGGHVENDCSDPTKGYRTPLVKLVG